jgi:hypothetical protein
MAPTRRQQRAQAFGARHPRLTLILIGPVFAATIALYGYQLRYGSYLGRGWVVAALSGMTAAAALIAVAVASGRRHSPAAGRLLMALLVLTLISASAIGFPFPKGPYGSVQSYFNVAHAAMLGFETVIGTAIVALMVYVVVRSKPHGRHWGNADQAGDAPIRKS